MNLEYWSQNLTNFGTEMSKYIIYFLKSTLFNFIVIATSPCANIGNANIDASADVIVFKNNCLIIYCVFSL